MRNVLDWLGGHVNWVLIAAIVVVGGTFAFIRLADRVEQGKTQRFDDWAVRALRKPSDPSVGIGPGWAPEAARDLTALGGFTVLFLVIAAVTGYLLIARKFAAAGLVLVATGGGLVLSLFLKDVMQRPRPEVVPHLSADFTTSFPSGHSMLSAVVYLTLGSMLARVVPRRRLKVYFIAVAFVLTFLVGVSRIYMGVHYPTDVMAGWTAGLVWALLCWLLTRYLQHRGTVERDTEGVA